MTEDDESNEAFDAYANGRYAARLSPEGPVENPFSKDSAQYEAFEMGVKAERAFQAKE
ncbi:hypothetical protein [Synechococcus phage Ssp-JY39]